MQPKDLLLSEDISYLTRKNNQLQEPTNLQLFNQQYYEEYKRLYETSFMLSIELKTMHDFSTELSSRINKIEKKNQALKFQISGDKGEKTKFESKRVRRQAESITRPFICTVDRCDRSYGSDGSLQQHIKIKHPDIYIQKFSKRDKNVHFGSGQQERN